ncbi:O-methyltransferase [Peptoniphilus catoniae]|uniref:O-methyltransferase n=1 Tax=Peptoniphilus catoniae TaxID=1660341 RepID=UPI0010FEC0C8|nr:O-methyltransferase [Peptoniphilus catoniae]
MTNINYEYIEGYIKSLNFEEDPKILSMRNYAKENSIPIIGTETEEFIKFLAYMKNSEKILELGTAIGYSSIILAKASKNLKKLKTIEINKEIVKIANKNIEDFKLSDKIKVINEDAYLYLQDEKEVFDLIFIDAAKGQYQKYFDLAIRLLNSNGIIICDNVLFKGMIASDDLINKRAKTIVKRLRKFLLDIKSNNSFISSIVPIGDGILLVRRKND